MLISSSPLTFLHDLATPAPHLRSESNFLQSQELRKMIPVRWESTMLHNFFNLHFRSSCWQKSGLEWTSSHSPRLTQKFLIERAWRNATSSNQKKAKRTAPLSSTLSWSTSTSGNSKRLVSACACGEVSTCARGKICQGYLDYYNNAVLPAWHMRHPFREVALEFNHIG